MQRTLLLKCFGEDNWVPSNLTSSDTFMFDRQCDNRTHKRLPLDIAFTADLHATSSSSPSNSESSFALSRHSHNIRNLQTCRNQSQSPPDLTSNDAFMADPQANDSSSLPISARSIRCRNCLSSPGSPCSTSRKPTAHSRILPRLVMSTFEASKAPPLQIRPAP